MQVCIAIMHGKPVMLELREGVPYINDEPLLGHAVGDECVSYLTHVLDHVHYDVMEYLGETDPQD